MNARAKLLDRRQQIHDAIREAAIDEFALNGLAGASTLAIATRAGLSKPQLHYYISSKEDLYEEVLIFIMDDWHALFSMAAASVRTPEDVIRGYVREKMEYSRQHPNRTKVFTNEVARGAPILRKYWDKSRESALQACTLIERWIEQGAIRPIDPMLFIMHIWAVTQHYADYDAQIRFMLDVDPGDAPDEERLVNEVTTLFLRFCGIEPSRNSSAQ